MNESPPEMSPAPTPKTGRMLIIALLLAAPAIIDLCAVSFGSKDGAGVPFLMLFLSLPMSLGAGLMAAFMMRTNQASLLLWIPVFILLALAVSLTLQAGSCSVLGSRIYLR